MAAIIFDFDGTIADSFDYITGFLAEAAKKPPLTAEQKQQLHGKSMASIGRQFGLSWFHLLRLFFKGRNQMHLAISQVEPFEGMPEVIRKFHAEGHELFILSHNTVANVHAFLHHYKLHTYFLEIYGGVGLLGKGPALRGLLKDQELDKQDALYIGDELRDVQAAQSIKMRAIGVTWGFARPADLEALEPTALVDSPDDLLRVLGEL